MNEELRIEIRAVTAQAQQELGEVREELNKVGSASKEAGKEIDLSMKNIAKSVAVAVTSITALTAALTSLGKASEEYKKANGKLVTSFQALGSNGKVANEIYRELYGFLGDTDRAVEAAQSLALITTNKEDLREWATILQGAFAVMGDKLPVENLAEAANETIKTGAVVGGMADALNWVGISEDAFNAKLAETNSLAEREYLVRSTLNAVYGESANLYAKNNASTIAYNNSQTRLNEAMLQASYYITPMMTALNNLAATILTNFGPAIQWVCGVIIIFTRWLAIAIDFIAGFFGIFQEEGEKATQSATDGLGSVQDALTGVGGSVGNITDGFKDTNAEVAKLKRQVMGFDELNVVNSPVSTPSIGGGGAGGGGGEITTPKLEIPELPSLDEMFNMTEFNQTLEEIEEDLKGILTLVGLVAAGFLTWKITGLLNDISTCRKLIKLASEEGALLSTKIFGAKAQEKLDGYKSKLMGIVGTLMIIAGAFLLIQGYTDAWANGVSWGNLTEMLIGIGLIVGGLVLSVGSFAGAIGLAFGGIALIIVGIKDFVENGYSMEAVITITIGVLAALVGVIWAFNSALLANPITWIIAAIIALVGVFVILWNECEWFREFWTGLWDGIVAAFKAVVNFFAEAGKAIGNFFVAAWEVIKNAWGAVINFFKGIWDGIVNIFKGVANWFGNLFSNAWKAITAPFNAVVNFFKGIWDKITGVFKNVGVSISKAISEPVKKAINTVLSGAIGIINGFISAINLAIKIINKIPGVKITELKKLDVPKLAKGGIIDSATLAVVGEQGKEAVVPLENNTEWMDKLADRLAQRSNTPSRIVLMLDGKELGWANINSINNITEETGELQLRLA